MNLADAIEKAGRVLDEEREAPTVDYYDPIYEWNQSETTRGYIVSNVDVMRAKQARAREKGQPRLNLYTERGRSPRIVHESPNCFVFASDNFKLLRVLLSRVSEDERGQFVSALLLRVPSDETCKNLGAEARFPSHRRCMSELPLVAEFCVRTGYTEQLMQAVSEVRKPTTGLVTLLYELEEMIALNFNLFSETELSAMCVRLKPLQILCDTLEKAPPAMGRLPTMQQMVDAQAAQEQSTEMNRTISGICEASRKAGHYYLKHELLQEIPNLEIESDKAKVVGFLDSLGFAPKLTASLSKAESLYRASSDGFDLKSCLGHLRSFYEHLNIDAGQAIAKDMGATVIDQWDPTLTFLRNNSFLSPQQEKFARGIYTLLSDEGVHSLIAEQEFARVLRNVVIEYGLMFLTMLQKKGAKITV